MVLVIFRLMNVLVRLHRLIAPWTSLRARLINAAAPTAMPDVDAITAHWRRNPYTTTLRAGAVVLIASVLPQRRRHRHCRRRQ